MKRTFGLDAHRDFLQITQRVGGQVVERSRVATDRRSLDRFAATLGEGDHVVLESTSFAWPIAQLLSSTGANVTVTNPAKTKAIASAKLKTDKVDADMLAQLAEADLVAEVWTPDPETLALRRRVAHRAQLVNHRTSCRRQINSILQRNLLRVPVSDLFGRSGREWLAGVQLAEHDRLQIDSLLRMHDGFEAEVKLVDRPLAQTCLDRADARLLLTIPGVGVSAALGLIATIGTIDRFDNPQKLVGYLGLDPKVRQSGNSPYRTGHISKQGATHTRALLVEAAHSAVRTPGPLRAFYQRVKARRGTQIASVAVARKLAIICWHMLKTGETYRYSVPSLTERKLHRLEHAAGRPHQNRDNYKERKDQERALLEQAQRAYETQVRARASHRDRDSHRKIGSHSAAASQSS